MILLLILAPVRVYREALADHLRRSSIDVVATAETPEEATRQADELGADALLVDASTPEALSTVQEVARSRDDLQLIAFGAPEREAEVLACAEAGIRAFVPAHADSDDLVAAVEAAVRGETVCSPRIASILLRRVAAMARPPAQAARELPLTAREHEIVALIDRGLSNKEIAAALCIEISTVKNHVHNILEKLGVRRRSEAAARVRVHAGI